MLLFLHLIIRTHCSKLIADKILPFWSTLIQLIEIKKRLGTFY